MAPDYLVRNAVKAQDELYKEIISGKQELIQRQQKVMI
jgi:hypothetical protein